MTPTYTTQPSPIRYSSHNSRLSPLPASTDPLLADFPHMTLPECNNIDHMLLQQAEDGHHQPHGPPPAMGLYPAYGGAPFGPPPRYNETVNPNQPYAYFPSWQHQHHTQEHLTQHEYDALPPYHYAQPRDDDDNEEPRLSSTLTSSTGKRKREDLNVPGQNSPRIKKQEAKDKESKIPKIAPELDENGTLHRYRCYQTDIWNTKFEMLVEYVQEHGHCNVPHSYEDNPELAQWVKRQRYQYQLKIKGKKRSTLSDERERKLEEIGFIWDAHRALWMERYQELEEYVATRGHCNVPSRSKEHPQLSVWVKCQRRQYRLLKDGDPSSNMTQERIDMLEALGIVWSPRGT